ncbi:MAG: ParB N-terminal domain-containing protein [Deltaproteobacteria bacterium]|nr:ParB N-terminal domain-containing protein [Deltaproteobacteria bacterium]
MHISRININHIDLSDESYSLAPPFCLAEAPAALCQSIERCGILHPPIVKEKSHSSFVIVSGRKRLLAAWRIAPAASYDCHKITDKTDEIATWAICLEDALLSRPLTPVERAVFFKKCRQWLDEEQLATRFLPLMGLASSTYLIGRDLKLLELEEPLIAAVHEGTLDDKVAFELGKFSFSDRMTLFAAISSLHLSVGNQKKLAISCRELAARGNTSISALLADPEVDDIIHHPEANIPQKTANLMRWLTRARFPRLSLAEKEFQHFTTGLHLPGDARLEPSPSFEKDELVFTLSCHNRDHFLTIWERIKDLFPAADTRKPSP